jgi:predicted nucleic acid-binding protein
LVGLLVVAKEMGFVESVGPFIEDLRNNGYWPNNNSKEACGRVARLTFIPRWLTFPSL